MNEGLKLASCPFCGGQSAINKTAHSRYFSDWKFVVECLDCYATLPHDSKDLAKEAWNKRNE